MNAITPVGRSLAPFEAQLKTLDGATRKASAGELARVGLPTRRVEAWHYTDLRALSGVDYAAPAASFDEAAARAALARWMPEGSALAGLPRFVLVNGRLAPGLSSPATAPALPEGVTVSSFADDPQFSPLADPEREPMVALNTALATDGVQISVDASVDVGTVLLVSLFIASGQDAALAVSVHPRHNIVLAEGAYLKVLELSAADDADGVRYCHNPVLTASIGQRAHLTHVKVQHEAAQAVHLATVYADVAEQGAYDSFTFGVGSALARHEVHATLTGVRSSVHVNGAQVLGGAQVGDITSVITHAAPDCISRQTVRNVLTDTARGVFQGKVHVHRVAQKTDGYQMNQALLLSSKAEIDAKPELEIYADDVKCSHGATVGALDDDQLFYLRSRGIPDEEARQILVEAFLADALDLTADPVLRDFLGDVLKTVLERRVAARPGKGEAA